MDKETDNKVTAAHAQPVDAQHKDTIKKAYDLGYRAGHRARSIELVTGVMSTSMGIPWRLLKAGTVLDGLPTLEIARVLGVRIGKRDDPKAIELRAALKDAGYVQRMTRHKGQVVRGWFKVMGDSVPV